MKMISFEFQMTKLDHLVLEADAANTRLAERHQRRLEATTKQDPRPKLLPLEMMTYCGTTSRSNTLLKLKWPALLGTHYTQADFFASPTIADIGAITVKACPVRIAILNLFCSE